ncbi:MAG: DUF2202 domain-containing protein [Rhizobium sp.]|nr:DUF2202 domain-containing protein [Rhizobium sp.]
MRPSLLLLAGLVIAGSTLAHHTSAMDLPTATRDALYAALADEHHAEAFYAAVVDKFGEVRPFSNIIIAEQRHASQLGEAMEAHGLQAGANVDLGSEAMRAAVPDTLAEACALGVEAEIANRDLYDKVLLPASLGHDDVTAVLTALRDASENNHLPAFQRCGGQGGNGQGMGHGAGMQHGKP